MKMIAIILTLGLAGLESANAGTCSIYTDASDKTFSESDIKALAAKGYSITSDVGSPFTDNLYIQTGSSCSTWIVFQSCEYTVSLGRSEGGSIGFGNPVTGSTLSKAISKLPSCP
jgi:hypothetical protein